MINLVRSIIVLLFGLSYLISVFFSNSFLTILINILAILIICLYFSTLSRGSKLMISGLLGVSLLLFSVSGDWKAAFHSFSTNVSILSIFIFVPLLNIPLGAAKYLEYMGVLYNSYIKNTRQLYVMTNTVTYGLSVLMNLGALPLVHQLTNSELYQSYNDIRYKALGRAYTLATFWSPYFISMALILTYFNVSWLELFPVGFTISFIGIILGMYLESNTIIPTSNNQTGPKKYNSLRSAWMKIIELIVIIFLLTTVIMLTEHFSGISVIPIIVLFSILLSMVWTLFYENVSYLIRKLKEFVWDSLPKKGNELTLFISAGAFGGALISIGAEEAIIYFLEVMGITNPLILIIIIMVFTYILGFFGVHPLITLSVIAITISSSSVFIDHHRVLAMGMMLTWALSILISPFTAANLLLSGYSGINPIEIGMKRNFKFIILMSLIGFLFIAALHLTFNY